MKSGTYGSASTEVPEYPHTRFRARAVNSGGLVHPDVDTGRRADLVLLLIQTQIRNKPGYCSVKMFSFGFWFILRENLNKS